MVELSAQELAATIAALIHYRADLQVADTSKLTDREVLTLAQLLDGTTMALDKMQAELRKTAGTYR